MRQASGEFCQQILDCDADVWAITESHLKDDPARPLIPRGYKVVSRKDRSKHGGGLLLGCKKHLLANPLDLKKYHTTGVAELDGFTLDGIDYIGLYTPNSACAPFLFQALTQYILDHPQSRFVIMGDPNVHHAEWLHSSVPTDKAGVAAYEFCKTFGLHQYINFPTRGDSTLDPIISSFPGSATQLPNLGSSDHVSIKFHAKIVDAIQGTPKQQP